MKKYCIFFLNLSFLFFASLQGMEVGGLSDGDEQAFPVLSAAARLRRCFDALDDNFSNISRDAQQPAPELGQLVIQNSHALQDCFQTIKGDVHEAALRRLDEGKSSGTHAQIIRLFDSLEQKLEQVNQRVARLDGQYASQLERKKAVRFAHLSGCRALNTLDTFFGLINDEDDAYEVSRTKILSSVLEQLKKNPLRVEHITQDCYNRWYNADGLADRYRRHMVPRIEEAAHRLFGKYREADLLREEIRELNRELEELDFQLFDVPRRLIVRERDEQLAELALQRTICEERKKQAKRTLHEVYERPYSIMQPSACSRGVSSSSSSSSHHRSGAEQEQYQRYVQPLGNALNETMRYAGEIAIAYNCLDDALAQYVIAAENQEVNDELRKEDMVHSVDERSFLLADLASRLQVMRQQEGPLPKDSSLHAASEFRSGKPSSALDKMCVRLAKTLHAGCTSGYKSTDGVESVPRKIKSAGKTITEAPQGWSMAVGGGVVNAFQATAGAFQWGTSFLRSKPEESESKGKEKDNADYVSKQTRRALYDMGRSLEDAGQQAESLLSTVVGLVTGNARKFLQLHAMARLLEGYACTDARARSLGEFRSRFDRYGVAWNNPGRYLPRELEHPVGPQVVPVPQPSPHYQPLLLLMPPPDPAPVEEHDEAHVQQDGISDESAINDSIVGSFVVVNDYQQDDDSEDPQDESSESVPLLASTLRRRHVHQSE